MGSVLSNSVPGGDSRLRGNDVGGCGNDGGGSGDVTREGSGNGVRVCGGILCVHVPLRRMGG